jgi:hypothetical protein
MMGYFITQLVTCLHDETGFCNTFAYLRRFITQTVHVFQHNSAVIRPMPRGGELCVADLNLLPISRARQYYRYTSVPIEAGVMNV